MKSLKEQLDSYAAYHRDQRNKLTHFVGVPLVMFSLLLGLSWFRFAPAPDVPLSAATLFYLTVFVYYVRLDRGIALVQAPFTLALLVLADRAAVLPLVPSLAVFAGTFVGGWVIQLVGHAFEGRRPALADNLLQVFNAPLFLTVEVVQLLGFRKDLADTADRERPAESASAGADQRVIVHQDG